jgi:integrase
MKVLRARHTLAARVLELQILTNTRPGEASGARWEEFNLDAKLWTVPAERMKRQIEHRIPLSAAALNLLKALTRKSPYVFPGKKDKPLTTAAGEETLKALHVNNIAKGGEGYMDLRQKRPAVPHGFRSTFRDWGGETTNHPREILESAMSHLLKDESEAAYARGDLLRRRELLMTDWAKFCES